MSIKALQEYTRYSKYAKFLPEKQRRETWEEQVNRIFEMHETKLGEKLNLIKDKFELSKNAVLKRKVLGSQRALQFGGKAILDKNARLYNCSSTYLDRPRAFQESLYLLLCGTGVGFSVQTHHINKLPNIKKRSTDEKEFIIPDTIEGWADSLGILLSSYFDDSKNEFKEFFGKKINFNFSKIRKKGSKLSWGGKAPGPEGLKNSLIKIENLIEKCLNEGKTKLESIDVYDIVMHSSDAVLSGGVRRSATICIFSPEDEKMCKAKTGDWFKTNPQRGRSNNSALLVRNETTKEQFNKLMTSVKEFGEPGFVWAEDKETLYNPCISKETWITTENGAFQVKDLINKQFNAIVDGKSFISTEKGFYLTGEKDLYDLKTKEGFSIKATDNHKFLIDTGTEYTWIELKNIREGDKIVIHNHENNKWEGNGILEEGWLLGNLLGDGNIEKNTNTVNLEYWGENCEYMIEQAKLFIDKSNIKHRSDMLGGYQTPSLINNIKKMRIGSVGLFSLVEKYNMHIKKEITDEIEKGSHNFYKGFLQGWFDADGSIQGNFEKGLSIRLWSVDYNSLIKAQRMLLRMGILSKVYKERTLAGNRMLPDSKGELKEYPCQAGNELIISKKSIIKFFEIINFSDPIKKEKLKNIINSYKREPYSEKFVATIISKEYIGTEEVYDCTIPEIHCFDANGLMTHNCVEIGMRGYDDKGQSGWSFCNLCEINVKKCKTPQDFYDACETGSIIGTIQASYTDFPYLGTVTESIVKREALIGISMTGIMDNPDIALNPEIQKKGAEVVKSVNKYISEKIGINQSARTTCTKPAGSTSCLLGTSSGIHPGHAKRYFRRVQANKMEFPAQYFQMNNPLAVEESVWSANKTDVVLTFVCEVSEGGITKNMVSAIDLLKNVKLTQQNWVEYGTNVDLCVIPTLRHNVSNTITVKPEEWEDVENFIYDNRQYFAGISLLSSTGDLDYPQAPFCTIHNPIEICKLYGDGSLMASGLIVDGLRAFDGNLWAACDCVLGVGESLDLNEEQKKLTNGKLKSIINKLSEKDDWVRRAKQFAQRYFENDFKRMTYCLKEVHNWKLWCDLKREYVDIDWSLAVEEKYEIDVSKISGEACSGGSCDTGDLGASIKASKEN